MKTVTAEYDCPDRGKGRKIESVCIENVEKNFLVVVCARVFCVVLSVWVTVLSLALCIV